MPRRLRVVRRLRDGDRGTAAARQRPGARAARLTRAQSWHETGTDMAHAIGGYGALPVGGWGFGMGPTLRPRPTVVARLEAAGRGMPRRNARSQNWHETGTDRARDRRIAVISPWVGGGLGWGRHCVPPQSAASGPPATRHRRSSCRPPPPRPASSPPPLAPPSASASAARPLRVARPAGPARRPTDRLPADERTTGWRRTRSWTNGTFPRRSRRCTSSSRARGGIRPGGATSSSTARAILAQPPPGSAHAS